MKKPSQVEISPHFSCLRLILYALLTSGILPSAYSQPESFQKIWVLLSYHQGNPWEDEIIKGIQSVFGEDQAIELIYDYLDAKHDHSDEYYEHLVESFRLKYAAQTFDVVLCCDDFALTFYLSHYKRFFPHVPVVFCGVNFLEFHPLDRFSNITGIVETPEYQKFYEIIFQLHPAVKDYYIFYFAPPDEEIIRFFEIAIKERGGKVQTYHNIPHDDFLNELKRIPSKCIVLLGNTPPELWIPYQENQHNLYRCNSPIYMDWIGMNDWNRNVRRGILGANVLSGSAHGQQVARLVSRILHGEQANDIPISHQSPSVPYFNYEQMKRYGIRESLLPAESIVQYKIEPFYITHKYLFLGILVCLILETAIIVGLFLNLARRKRAEREKSELEEKLRQSQKMEAIGRLAGGIAHDFNNLLTGILGYSGFILRQYPHDSFLQNSAKQIRDSGERAASLTRQLLAYSRKQIFDVRIININDTVQNMEKMLRPLIGEDIEFITILDPNLSNIKADPTQIEQIILNLAINARDAMPTGGKIVLETRHHRFQQAYQQADAQISPGDYAMLSISDTGVGIEKKNLEKIFEPFFTTKEMGKGTGLGLSTVYGIVKQSQGFIFVYSEKKQGNHF